MLLYECSKIINLNIKLFIFKQYLSKNNVIATNCSHLISKNVRIT